MQATATARSAFLVGLDPVPVTVTATHDTSVEFVIEGLPSEAALRETSVRVRGSLATLDVLPKNIRVQIEPKPPPGCSSQLDLAIAVAVGALLGVAPTPGANVLLLGELSLAGRVKPVRGMLPMLDKLPYYSAIVAPENRREAALVNDRVYAASSLSGVLEALPQPTTRAFGSRPSGPVTCLSDIRGMPDTIAAVRAAIADQKSILLVGPPGSGKTLIARAIANELPLPVLGELLAITKIHSVAGLVDPEVGYVAHRPFRAPHHSVSEAGLIGGGAQARPGEVSLAHGGVLFLDELVDFRRAAIESLRHAVRDGEVALGRRLDGRSYVTRYPACPLLIGATNPCPCGYRGHPTRECRCSPERLKAYQKRIPRDLFDVAIDVPVALPLLLGSQSITSPASPDPK